MPNEALISKLETIEDQIQTLKWKEFNARINKQPLLAASYRDRISCLQCEADAIIRRTNVAPAWSRT